MVQNTLYLTIDRDREKGGMIAVISQGQPQVGDTDVTILSVERVKNRQEAEAWFLRMKIEQPWNTRN